MQDWQHMRRDLILYFITYFFLFSFLMRGFFSVGLCLENEFYFGRFCPASKTTKTSTHPRFFGSDGAIGPIGCPYAGWFVLDAGI